MRRFSSQVCSKLGLNRDKGKQQQVEANEEENASQGAGAQPPQHPLKARPHRAYGRGHRHHAFVPYALQVRVCLCQHLPC